VLSHARSGRATLRVVSGLIAALLLASCTPTTEQPLPTPTVADPWAERGPITLAGGGSPDAWDGLVQNWNSLHPNEPVTLVDLPTSANQRHAAIAERAQANSGEYTVIALDVTWTTEFAKKGWLTELPPSRFPTDAMVPAAVASASWNDVLYAYPKSTDAGLLYFRQDLLSGAELGAPTTWRDLEATCSRLGMHGSMSCFGLSLTKDEPLTVAFVESIGASGGQLVTSAGLPSVDSMSAVAGLEWLADGVSGGVIAEDAMSWSEADAVRAFAEGKLVFLRGWATAGTVFDSADPNTVVVGKTGVARLPGRMALGPSVLGGENLAISTFARNKGTAADFLAYVASDAAQRGLIEDASQGPVLSALYADAELVARHPYLSVLQSALGTAVARPVTVRYGEVTQAIQEQASGALRGERTAAQAMAELQSKLETLLK